jgi:hypothetical protein
MISSVVNEELIVRIEYMAFHRCDWTTGSEYVCLSAPDLCVSIRHSELPHPTGGLRLSDVSARIHGCDSLEHSDTTLVL